LTLQICPASAKGAVSVPRFACKRRMPRSANKFSCGSYIVPLYWRYVARTASPILPELSYNLGRTDRKWKKGINKMETT
jgi:hypothetical protein